MELGIAIGIVLILGIAFLVIRKPPKKHSIARPNTSIAFWSDKEAIIIYEINKYRIKKNKPPLQKNDYCKHIADKRTLFWKTNDYKKEDNFHDFIYSDTEPYTNAGLLTLPFENSQLSSGLAIVKNWENSPRHNAVMLGNFTKGGISIREKENGMFYASLIVAN